MVDEPGGGLGKLKPVLGCSGSCLVLRFGEDSVGDDADGLFVAGAVDAQAEVG